MARGSRRTHAPGQSRHGGRSRCCRTLRRRARLGVQGLKMQSFTTHTGKVALLARVNVDTDQIIPKQFLKRIERTGYGDVLFFDWRYDAAGKPNPEFPLNAAQDTGASILLALKNFGSGSSREHAAWALRDDGFRSVWAPASVDIFP